MQAEAAGIETVRTAMVADMPNKWTELNDEDLIALDDPSSQPEDLQTPSPPLQNDLIQVDLPTQTANQPALSIALDQSSSAHAEKQAHADEQNQQDVKDEQTDTVYLEDIEEETQQISLQQDPISVITGEGAELDWLATK